VAVGPARALFDAGCADVSGARGTSARAGYIEALAEAAAGRPIDLLDEAAVQQAITTIGRRTDGTGSGDGRSTGSTR
jgi:hypothetical protein